jgi:hypothetical protein
MTVGASSLCLALSVSSKGGIMNGVIFGIVALAVAGAFCLFAIARVSRLSGEITDLMLDNHALKKAHKELMNRYEDCARERDQWKRLYANHKGDK